MAHHADLAGAGGRQDAVDEVAQLSSRPLDRAVARLPESSAKTHVLLQSRCPLDVAEHLSIIYDAVALRWIRKALGRPGPADPGFHPGCLPV